MFVFGMLLRHFRNNFSLIAAFIWNLITLAPPVTDLSDEAFWIN